MAFFIVTCLVVGFQNCAQNGANLSADLGSGDLASQAPSADAAFLESTPEVTFVEIPQYQTLGKTSSLTDSLEKRLVISTATGRIQLMDSKNAVHGVACLNFDDFSKFKKSIEGSAICAAGVTDAEICAMRYKPPYAVLFTGAQERISLGEELNSCGRGKVDLCGDIKKDFQEIIQHIELNWKSMACAD